MWEVPLNIRLSAVAQQTGTPVASGLVVASPNAVQLRLFCRSELAREELTGAAFIQETRVIVDVFREQARSYKKALTERH